MPQFSSTRFRWFTTTFVLAAVALASCSAQSTPVVQATGADPAQVVSTPAGRRADPKPSDKPAKPLPESLPSPVGTDETAAVPLEPPDRTGDDGLAAQAPAAAASGAESKRAEPAPLEVAQLPPSALLAVNAPSFSFAPDDAGQLIGTFFALPRPIAAAPVESRAEDRAWPRSAERPPRDLIPAAEFSGPRVIPLERVALVPLRPVIDLPPLGVEFEITRPARPSLPLAPKTALAGPDPQRLPELPLLGRMNEGVVTLSEDATGAPFLRSLLSPLGSLRTAGIPFVPPPPLDPLAHAHDFELGSAPADNDPPARPTAPLPAPVLP